MTEPKQSFTEEMQKERNLELGDHALAFDRGVAAALSTLSKVGGREFYIEPANYAPDEIDHAPDGFDAIVHKTKFHPNIHVIEYSALVAERARTELQRNKRELDLKTYLKRNLDLESENAALKVEITDLKQAFKHGRKAFNKANNDCVDLMEELATTKRKLEKAIKQRNIEAGHIFHEMYTEVKANNETMEYITKLDRELEESK